MNGKSKNLILQVDALFRKDNQKSISTRYRYRAAAYRFCAWLGENTNVKKYKNIKIKYLYKYVEYLKECKYAPAYIMGDLSGIRYFYVLSGGSEHLPENKKFNLEHRNFGGVERAWSVEEAAKAVDIAETMQRFDVSMAIKITNALGLRLEEAVTLTTKQVKDALCSKELYVINTKGKHPRVVLINNQCKINALHYLLEHKVTEERIFIGKHVYTHKVKKSIQDWIRNHRREFQDKDRISSKDARIITRENRDSRVKDAQPPKANLTMHGNRHAFAQESFLNYIEDRDTKKEAKKDVSEDLGHHREDITNVYLCHKNR